MRVLLLISMILALGACDNNTTVFSDIPAPAQDVGLSESGKYGGAPGGISSEPAPAPAAPSAMVLDRSKFNGRRIAETHTMDIETSYDKLQSRYKSDYAKCIELGCDITSSSIRVEEGGQITARISPEKLGAFLDFLADGPGKILNHAVSADDQTLEYSDTKVQMDNLVALRDRLRALLDGKADKVRDILSIEQELTRVQTEIDSRTQRLRILEQNTNMATVNLNYSVEYRPVEVDDYTLANTWHMTKQRFLGAVDAVIQFVGGALPWLPVLFGGLWLTIRVVRLAFARVPTPWMRRCKTPDAS